VTKMCDTGSADRIRVRELHPVGIVWAEVQQAIASAGGSFPNWWK
jgi:hypothetical protein